MKRKFTLNEDIELDDVESMFDSAEDDVELPLLDEPTEEQENIGITQMLSDLIKDEWEAIDGYKSTIATLKSLGGNEDIIKVLEDISTEEMIHVGELEKCLQIVAPEASEIETGHDEAEENIEASNSDEVESDSEPIKENLDFSGKGYDDYIVYWMDEALSEVEYLKDDGDDDYSDMLRQLSDDAIEELCHTCALDITNSEYIWEQVNDRIRDCISENISEIFEHDIHSTDINPEDVEGE